jgi:integrase
MARPKKTSLLDLSERLNLTVGAIERLTCRTDIKCQAFLRDSEVPALRVRVTNTGTKSFVFEKKLNRQTIRRTIGAVSDWTIEAARKEAQALAVTLNKGDDPRELDRAKAEAKAQAKAEKERAANFTFGALMADYANELERQGKSSHAKVRGMVRLHLMDGGPRLANTAAALVSAEQVADLLRGLQDAGKERTAGKLRSYCRAAFEMARTSKLSLLVPVHFKSYGVQHNPAAETVAIKLVPDKNPLMPVHLRQYWQAIEPLQDVRGAAPAPADGWPAHRTTAPVGPLQRGGGRYTLLDAKGRTGRGARLHTIPLLPAAREALDALLALNPGEFPLSVDGGASPVSAKAISDWAKDAAAGVEWVPTDKPVGQFQAKRIRSGVETALASLRVSQETRGHLLSHGVTGVQAAYYDGHDYAPQ